MNVKKITECLNTIVKAGQPWKPEDMAPAARARLFGLGDTGLSFIGEDLTLFVGAVDMLYTADPALFRSLTRNTIESEVIGVFRDAIRSKTMVSVSDATSFVESFRRKPLHRYSVMRNIYGVTLRKLSEPLRLGPYTIFHYPSTKPLIDARLGPHPEEIWFGEEPPNFVIEYTTEAREAKRAIEIADESFSSFELMLSFMIGDTSGRFEVGILTYEGWRNRKAYVVSDTDETVLAELTSYGSIEPIIMDSGHFTSASLGFDLLWSIVGARNNNELRRRLKLAAEWIGQSYIETSPASAFIKAAVSLEILFTFSEKTLINASILSQIAESVALLLAGSLEERIGLEAEMKRLYALRSAIVHSGKTEIVEADFYKLVSVARRVVTVMLSNRRLEELTSIADVFNYIKRAKFSIPEL